MAIQQRRGSYANFDKSKLIPGEPAVVLSGDPNATDGKAAYIAFGSGDVKRLATDEDLASKVDKTQGKGLSTNDYTTEEKNKLNGIEEQANKTIVDSALSDSSTNPVQNKVTKAALDDLKDNLNDKADVIISTASGSIAHFEDGAEADAKSVIAHIEPVQEGSGDPSPDNVRHITGHTEANVTVSPTTDAQDGEAYPITFPTEAGTVYGGYVDAAKGELVVDRAKSTVVSSMTFGTVGSSGHGWYIARSSIAPLNTGKNYDTGIVCDKLPTAIGSSTLAQDLIFVNTNGQIRINTAQVFNTKEDMLSYFGDSIDIVYPIEPITYQLTSQQITTLLGINNIWNDCNGNTDVEYKADTKLYIEQLTKPTEDDMTANANIASGKFFMVGNRLFLSTSAIASGDTINPGTNCTELSLADALNNL